MTLQVFKDYDALSAFAAEKIVEQVNFKSDSVLCLATGNTPVGTYHKLSYLARDRKVDFSKAYLVALDEWMGIPSSMEGSCHKFLHDHIVMPLGLSHDRIFLFDGLTQKPEEECSRMDSTVRSLGGIDLMVVGIGKNGHIGFNEPGVSPDLFSHVMELEEFTRKEGQKYFASVQPIKRGITLGIQHFLQSGTAIILANGEAKSEIIFRALNEEISSAIPAGYIRMHDNGYVMVDSEAGKKILSG